MSVVAGANDIKPMYIDSIIVKFSSVLFKVMSGLYLKPCTVLMRMASSTKHGIKTRDTIFD